MWRGPGGFSDPSQDLIAIDEDCVADIVGKGGKMHRAAQDRRAGCGQTSRRRPVNDDAARGDHVSQDREDARGLCAGTEHSRQIGQARKAGGRHVRKADEPGGGDGK